MTGKNIWRLCKVYGRLIGYPELKPHDLRHGVAMEVLEQHHDLEQVRALLGHARIDTTQVYTSIRPPQLKRAVSFYEEQATRMLGGEKNVTQTSISVASGRARKGRNQADAVPGLRNSRLFLKHGAKKINEIRMVAPTGFEPVFQP